MKITGIILSLLISIQVFGNEVQSEVTPKKESILEANPYVIKRSYDHREDKKFQILARMGIDYTETGVGLGLGYFLSRQHLIELSYFSSDEDYESDSSYSDRVEELRVISLGSKIFSGNSFYMSPAIFYSDYEYSYTCNDCFIFSDRSFKRSDLGISFRIGNQWQWDNFTLGCDWIGIQYGVENINKSGRRGGLIPDVRDNETWISATLLNLSMGVSF
jgi:hypothetical protein